MTTRVTQSDLEAIVKRINRLTGNPETPYVRPETGGSHVAQVGNYHIDYAYGGVALHQISNTSGGVRDVLRVGHVSKRDLQRLMFAYIEGLYDKTATGA